MTLNKEYINKSPFVLFPIVVQFKKKSLEKSNAFIPYILPINKNQDCKKDIQRVPDKTYKVDNPNKSPFGLCIINHHPLLY